MDLVECPSCHGSAGYVASGNENHGAYSSQYMSCSFCKGTGKVYFSHWGERCADGQFGYFSTEPDGHPEGYLIQSET